MILSLPSVTQELHDEWNQALQGYKNAQSEWKSEAGGSWFWNHDSVQARSTGTEWSDYIWQKFSGSTITALKNFVIEVTVRGKAEAAGLSFGDFKDFLVRLDSHSDQRRLQLEIDLNA